jgi:hypothetical protein
VSAWEIEGIKRSSKGCSPATDGDGSGQNRIRTAAVLATGSGFTRQRRFSGRFVTGRGSLGAARPHEASGGARFP